MPAWAHTPLPRSHCVHRLPLLERRLDAWQRTQALAKYAKDDVLIADVLLIKETTGTMISPDILVREARFHDGDVVLVQMPGDGPWRPRGRSVVRPRLQRPFDAARDRAFMEARSSMARMLNGDVDDGRVAHLQTGHPQPGARAPKAFLMRALHEMFSMGGRECLLYDSREMEKQHLARVHDDSFALHGLSSTAADAIVLILHGVEGCCADVERFIKSSGLSLAQVLLDEDLHAQLKACFQTYAGHAFGMTETDFADTKMSLDELRGEIKVEFSARGWTRKQRQKIDEAAAWFFTILPVCFISLDTHPLFQQCTLDAASFEESGECNQFSGTEHAIGANDKGEKGETYYEPARQQQWWRFGLKALGRYDGGDAWLQPFGDAANWWRVYQGIEHTALQGVANLVNADGEDTGECGAPKLGHGVYVTPHLEYCAAGNSGMAELEDSPNHETRRYTILFQSAARPGARLKRGFPGTYRDGPGTANPWMELVRGSNKNMLRSLFSGRYHGADSEWVFDEDDIRPCNILIANAAHLETVLGVRCGLGWVPKPKLQEWEAEARRHESELKSEKARSDAEAKRLEAEAKADAALQADEAKRLDAEAKGEEARQAEIARRREEMATRRRAEQRRVRQEVDKEMDALLAEATEFATADLVDELCTAVEDEMAADLATEIMQGNAVVLEMEEIAYDLFMDVVSTAVAEVLAESGFEVEPPGATARVAAEQAEAEAAARAAEAEQAEAEARAAMEQAEAEARVAAELVDADRKAAERLLQMLPRLLKEESAEPAKKAAREMLRLQLQLHADDQEHTHLARAKTMLAQALVRCKEIDEALPLLAEALAAHVASGRHLDRLRTSNMMCHVYRACGRLDDAELVLKDTIDACTARDGTKARDAMHFKFQLGNVLSTNEKKLEEAESVLREAVAGLAEVLGADREDTLNATGALGMLLRKRKKDAEAEPILEGALSRARSTLGAEHRITLSLLNNIGVMYSSAGRLEESEALYREALATKRTVFGGMHLSTLNTIHNLGALLHRMKKHDESYELLAEEYNARQELQGVEARDSLKVMSALGRVQIDRGHADEGEALLRECTRLSVINASPPDEMVHQAAHDLVDYLAKAGHPAEDLAPFKELVKTHTPPEEESEEEHDSKDARTDSFAPVLSLAQIAMTKMWADRAVGNSVPAKAQTEASSAVAYSEPAPAVTTYSEPATTAVEGRVAPPAGRRPRGTSQVSREKTGMLKTASEVNRHSTAW